RALLPSLHAQTVIINVSSDAGVEHYETWGGYGSSKAALDHQTLTWAAEEPEFRWYSLDPGDMRTAMQQAAYPGEDISDRPEAEAVAPIVVALIGSRLPSGRYRAAELIATLAERTVSQ
ncbi:MAG TPA: SDR family NAD(P)-dependent oxidoreductase, partial [Propionibacteriaceae bacterium]|nr:SDR family NAD(P)-dependent oxidoreductase [Propionibacteriaceae bacterium]